MFKGFYSILIIVSIFGLTMLDANAQGLRICSVNYEGVEKHRERYLSKQVNSHIGEALDLKQVEKDLSNLSSLPSIGRAECKIDTAGDCISLTYLLDESITGFPIINFGLIEENYWFKLGFGSLNIAGLGHQLIAEYQYSDYFHNYNFYYKVPYWGKSKWGNSISVSKYSSIEPLYFDEGTVNYNYEIRNYGIGTSYSFSPNNGVELSLSYFQEQYMHSENQFLDSPPGPVELDEDKFLTMLTHRLKNLHYNYYKLDGWQNKVAFQHVSNLENGYRFFSFTNDLSFYKTIGHYINFASRLRFGIASNDESPFSPFVLDSYVNIRGVGNRVDRGTAKLILNLEYRQTIFEYKNIASQLVVFSDQGNWRRSGGELNELFESTHYRHFLGGGLRLIYRKGHNYIFRMDYGVDIMNSKEQGFVIGVGQYF